MAKCVQRLSDGKIFRVHDNVARVVVRSGKFAFTTKTAYRRYLKAESK